MTEIREAVRQRYASAALEMAKGDASCCGPECCGPSEGGVSCANEYSAEDVAAIGMDPRVSLGCGNPLLLADLRPGQKVLDLGSGAGLDVLLSARRVAPGAGVGAAWPTGPTCAGRSSPSRAEWPARSRTAGRRPYVSW